MYQRKDGNEIGHGGDNVVQFEKSKEDRYFRLLGPLKQYLDNPFVTEIDVNDNGTIWVDEFGKGVYCAPETMDDQARENLISWMTSETLYGRAVDHLHSEVQCDAPVYGSRCQFHAPPLGNWTMAWRQHRKDPFSLEDYRDKEEMSPAQFEFAIAVIKEERNLGIGGNTGSGKTTLLNAGLRKKAEIYPKLRAVGVQDRKELRLDLFANNVPINVRIEQERQDGTRWTFDFANGLEAALRKNIGFLVWSEVRDPQSAVGLMLASNTGTDGLLYTVHANSCVDMPARIEELVRLDNKTPSPRYIVKMNEAVIFMERDRESGRRYIKECGFIRGFKDGEYIFEKVA